MGILKITNKRKNSIKCCRTNYCFCFISSKGDLNNG